MNSTLESRFRAKVISGIKPDDCWSWSGAKDHRGYGRLNKGRRGEGVFRAHQASWVIHKGEIPPKAEVCHACDNPICSNPLHLFLGSHAQNMADSARKGRSRKTMLMGIPRNIGETNGQAKLTDKQVAEIHMMSASGMRQRAIGKLFGVRQQHISRILRSERRRIAVNAILG